MPIRHRTPNLLPRKFVVGTLATTMCLGLLADGGQAQPPVSPAMSEPALDLSAPALAATGGAVGEAGPTSMPAAGDEVTITLITGDRVHYAETDGVMPQVHVELDPESGTQEMEILAGPDSVLVIPDQAAPLIEADLIDPSLFDVRYLAANGYTDQEVDALPVIVTYDGTVEAASSASTAERLAGHSADLVGTTGQPTPLESINGAGVRVDKENAEGFWSEIQNAQVQSGSAKATADGAIDKVWLDRKTFASLDDSRLQIGIPEAWEAGYDGSGVTVAVLDSGYDPLHPDLIEQVTHTKSFVPGEEVVDGAGHGTHVASIVAGTGAASDGRYSGVAPGADLAIGKVLSDSGRGQDSWIIAGMEWAADNADVVNMSLGSYPSDGNDPVSQALNQISEESGTLFVVAAGNSGADATVTAPATADAALAVGAVDIDNQTASFSSRGPRRGDGALKPEIAAPGSPIVAARASSVTGGALVGEHYLANAGTSMASPHVAGVAALLLQKYPDLDPAGLKDALQSTSAYAGAPVYEQGVGRVDAARATQQELFASGQADFGWFDHQASSGEVQTRTVTYTNTGEQELVVDLEIEVEGSGDALQLGAQQLTVPAGGQAQTDATLQPEFSAAGTFSGVVRGTTSDGNQVVTAVAYSVAGPTHQITVKTRDRLGQIPAAGNLVLQDRRGRDEHYETARPDANGQATFDVPPGDYVLLGYVSTDERPGVRHSSDLFSVEILGVDDDRTVSIDAADAVDYDFDIVGEKRSLEATQLTQSIFHRAVDGERGGLTLLSDQIGSNARFGAIPTVTADDNEDAVELSLITTLAEPLITATMRGPGGGQLETAAAEWSGRFDGVRRVGVVDVGFGSAAEYEGLDVTGKLVLVDSDDPWVAEQATIAADHGAAAMMVVPSGPGTMKVAVAQDSTLPVLAAPFGDGQRIRNQLQRGDVVVTLTGRLERSFAYTIRGQEDEGIPQALHYRVKKSELAVIENSFHAEADRTGSAVISAYPQWIGGAGRFYEQVRAPAVRTDYVAAGPGIEQRQSATSSRQIQSMRMSGPPTAYGPGERVQISWFRAPNHPAGFTELPCNFCRSEALLQFAPSVVGDAEPTHIGSGRYSTVTTAYRDGELIERPELLLVPEPATYRIERTGEAQPNSEHVLANRSKTEWTFVSEAPSEVEIEDCGSRLPGANACAALSVILVGYDVPLALDNTAPAGRTFDFIVRTQRAKGYAGAPEVAGVDVSVSYDDGVTWHPATSSPQPRSHDFRVRVRHPQMDETNGFVSLRIEAWDDAGNRTSQVVDRAYGLS